MSAPMRPADHGQRDRGRDPAQSFIVQAPAGSGKTELLTQRMLALLARAEHPEEVVAITFTRKAAAEMSHRLVSRLRLAHEEPGGQGLKPHELLSHQLAAEVLDNSARRGWNLLRHPGRLRIRTIDSLCSDLARQLPVLSRLGGGQSISEDPAALYRQAAAQTLALIENPDDEDHANVARILHRYDNQYDRLVNLVSAMLARRDQWLPHVLDARRGSGFDRAALEDALEFLVEDQLKQALALIPDTFLDELRPILRFNLEHEPEDSESAWDLLEQGVCASAESLGRWKTLANRLLVSSATAPQWRKAYNARLGFPALGNASAEEKDRRRGMKARMEELVATLTLEPGLAEALHSIRLLPNPHYDDEAWEALESMMHLLLRASQEWKLVLAESGEADFVEISYRAIEALGIEGQPTNLALKLDYRIRHILVDEFQDTSHSQVRLLERLTEGWSAGDGRTLFLVGDPMQSIYRFRKAEVSLFLQAFAGELFEHLALQPLVLGVNFRSGEPIVAWINQVFSAAMPRRDDPVKGAVRFAPSQARPAAPTQGRVQCHFMPLTDTRDDEAEAQQMADIIKASDPDKTIAVLVRARHHALALVALLDEWKERDERFRYQAVDVNSLADTPHVTDLVSLTLALLQPADRLAWLSVLRSPFVGLDLGDLSALASADWNQVLAQTVAEGGWTGVSEEGLLRLQRCREPIQHALDRRGRCRVRELVSHCWKQLGGPACLENRGELEDAETYFDLLDAMEQAGLPIDRDSLEERMRELFARPDARASGKLQIMTIHKAKGLQFDTVLLPGLDRRTSGSDHKLLHWFELADENRIVMSVMRNADERELSRKEGDLIQTINEVEKQRDQFESTRLAYVAATRAETQLHLFAQLKPGKNESFEPGRQSLLARLWPALKEQQVPVLAAGLATTTAADVAISGDADEDSGAGLPQLYRRLSAHWQPPEPPAGVERSYTDPEYLAEDSGEFIEFSWAGEERRLAGDLVHRLLEAVSRQGLEGWAETGGMEVRQAWCLAQLQGNGLEPDRARLVVASVRKAIDGCLASETGRWILEAHMEAESELALTAVLKGRLQSLKLDRSFVDGDERWIVDYKTSSHAGGDLEGFLDNEEDRYRDQLRRYRDAVALTETRPIRCALYFPLLDAFREVSFD